MTECNVMTYGTVEPSLIGKQAQDDIKNEIGTKDDIGKPDVTLVDPLFIEEVAKVMMAGVKKYKRGNWQLNLSPLRILGALIRHSYCILRGEWLDQESGLSHAAHVGCNAMFLEFYRRKGVSLETEHNKG